MKTKIGVLEGPPCERSVRVAGVNAAGWIRFLVSNSHFPHEQRIEDGTMTPKTCKLDGVVGREFIEGGTIRLRLVEHGNTDNAIDQSPGRRTGNRHGDLCLDFVPGGFRVLQG